MIDKCNKNLEAAIGTSDSNLIEKMNESKKYVFDD